MTPLTQPCQSMWKLPDSPQLSSSPKTLFVYDQRKNNYLLFKTLKETPKIIDQCIQKIRTSEIIEEWQITTPLATWEPSQTPFSPATVQGCYMEFCDTIPRALITPWGRQPLFAGKTYTPFIKKLTPWLLQRIVIAQKPHPTETSFWETKTDAHITTFFEVKTFNNILLEEPFIRQEKKIHSMEQIKKDWDYCTENYEEEQETAFIKKEMHAILAGGNSPEKKFIPIKKK